MVSHTSNISIFLLGNDGNDPLLSAAIWIFFYTDKITRQLLQRWLGETRLHQFSYNYYWQGVFPKFISMYAYFIKNRKRGCSTIKYQPSLNFSSFHLRYLKLNKFVEEKMGHTLKLMASSQTQRTKVIIQDGLIWKLYNYEQFMLGNHVLGWLSFLTKVIF